MSFPATMAAALLDPATDCPGGLISWNGSDPAQRFAIYRNNVMLSLIDALADTYPATQAMVGRAFFGTMARQYACAEPPVSPVMVDFGATFPDFVEAYAAASSVPYLADLARLEGLYVRAFHAADARILPLSELTSLLGDEDALARVIFRLHPSVCVLRSSFPVVSLWAAHQQPDTQIALQSINPDLPESALVLRSAQVVEVIGIEEGMAQFIENLLLGFTFADAVSHAVSFNLAAALELLIRGGAISGYSVQE